MNEKLSNPLIQAETKLGKWLDMQCEKPNMILCEYQQSWTLDKLVKTVLEFRKDLVGYSASTNKNTDSINNLNANPGYYKKIVYLF